MHGPLRHAPILPTVFHKETFPEQRKNHQNEPQIKRKTNNSLISETEKKVKAKIKTGVSVLPKCVSGPVHHDEAQLETCVKSWLQDL